MTAAERTAIQGNALLLYDGVCALCNGLVRLLLLQHDKAATLRYAPLQSPLGQEILARFNLPTLPDGIVLVTNALIPNERLYHRSDAALAAFQLVGGPWRPLAKVLRLIPRPLRELGYSVIARLRYRLFGRYDTCPLPTPGQRARILGMSE